MAKLAVLVEPYVKNWNIFACPSLSKGESSTYMGMSYPIRPTYGMNDMVSAMTPLALAEINTPASKICMADSNHIAHGMELGWLTAKGCSQWTCGRLVYSTHKWEVPHNDGLNVGFMDGHAKWLKGDQMWDLIQNGGKDLRN